MTAPPAGRLKRSASVETRRLKEGIVVVHMGTGQCYRLNRVGTEVWSLLDRPSTLSEISTSIAERHNRPASSVEPEIRELLEHLVRERLIESAA